MAGFQERLEIEEDSSSSSSEDEEFDLEKMIQRNAITFSSIFQRIFDKYDRDYDSDEVGGTLVDFSDEAAFNAQVEKLFPDNCNSRKFTKLNDEYQSSEEEEAITLDPEVTEKIREKVVRVKKEINWDEEEMAHQEMMEHRKRLKGEKSSSSSSEDETPCRKPIMANIQNEESKESCIDSADVSNYGYLPIGFHSDYITSTHYSDTQSEGAGSVEAGRRKKRWKRTQSAPASKVARLKGETSETGFEDSEVVTSQDKHYWAESDYELCSRPNGLLHAPMSLPNEVPPPPRIDPSPSPSANPSNNEAHQPLALIPPCCPHHSNNLSPAVYPLRSPEPPSLNHMHFCHLHTSTPQDSHSSPSTHQNCAPLNHTTGTMATINGTSHTPSNHITRATHCNGTSHAQLETTHHNSFSFPPLNQVGTHSSSPFSTPAPLDHTNTTHCNGFSSIPPNHMDSNDHPPTPLDHTGTTHCNGHPPTPSDHAGTTHCNGHPLTPSDHAGTTHCNGHPLTPSDHAGTTHCNGHPLTPSDHAGTTHCNGHPLTPSDHAGTTHCNGHPLTPLAGTTHCNGHPLTPLAGTTHCNGHPSTPSDHAGTTHCNGHPPTPSDHAGTTHCNGHPSTPSDHAGTTHCNGHPSTPSDHAGTTHCNGHPSTPSDHAGTTHCNGHPPTPSDHARTTYCNSHPPTPSRSDHTGMTHCSDPIPTPSSYSRTTCCNDHSPNPQPICQDYKAPSAAITSGIL